MTSPAHPNPLTCHWYSYGKLINPASAGKAVIDKFEHDITGLSEGFPEALLAKCRLSSMFGSNQDVIHFLAPAYRKTGAFIYRPVSIDIGEFGLFARIQAPPETGDYNFGRVFSQISILAVKKEDWSPEVIPLMYHALFVNGWGYPVIDDGKRRAHRHTVHIPHFERLPQIFRKNPEYEFAINRHSGIKLSVYANSLPAAATAMQNLYISRHMPSAQFGFALPFAFGVNQQIIAHDNLYKATLFPLESTESTDQTGISENSGHPLLRLRLRTRIQR